MPSHERDELIDRIVAAGGSPGASDPPEAFVRQYYRGAAADDLADRHSSDLHAAAAAHWRLGTMHRPGAPTVRLYRPTEAVDGWQSEHAVVDVVADDMPFLVDSVAMELNRHGLPVHLVLHPVFRVQRDDVGALVALLDPEDRTGVAESFLHVEFGRVAGYEPAALEADVVRVLEDVRRAVADWTPMRQRAEEIARELEHARLPVDDQERDEAVALLRWMVEERYTFLGYREYDLEDAPDSETGDALLREIPGSGLGILRVDPAPADQVTRLAPVISERAREPKLLNLTKTNARSTIHRPARLDYVGIKRFDDYGKVQGERRFLGLFTSAAYNASAFDVPVLRRKAIAVVARAGFPRGGHSTRKLVDIIETYPRDELFQISSNELYENAMGILRLQERQRVRLFRRVDPFERYVSCLVYVPRDRYTTSVRERIGEILSEAHAGTGVEYTARISESSLARLHFVVRTVPGHLPPFDHRVVEEELASAARSWIDDLHDALLAERGEPVGESLFAGYGGAFPAGYREDFAVGTAITDIERLDALGVDDLSLAIYRPHGAPAEVLRLKVYRTGERIALSDVLPVLEHLGVTVVDERPYSVECLDGVPRWIYDFGLQLGEAASSSVDRNRQNVLDAFEAVWRGDAENDGFNRLVLEAGLTWRQVVVLRSYRKYLRQIGSTFSQSYMERSVAGRPELIRLLMALFDARFNPDRPIASAEDRTADIEALALQVEVALELIESLDEDRIFRGFYRLMQATMRTNFYQLDADGRPKPYLSLKLDPTLLPDVPDPRPHHEIFLHSPRVEGVHLRGGDVARGGLRWSDRPEDFRTEVLGLMKAQLVKNSVIVPVGAKGGFIVKRPPAGGDREAMQAEGVACYREFISGLLDVTDNLVDGKAVPPDRLVRHDGDDTYLVVAADKGTATFSDLANELALDRDFWLGDAFASGGSVGYDHKKMGITARGAWESVKRHFRELGVDVQTTDFTVIGIGDMSGDVFGNGMLLSPHIRLVAAFDHRHVFLDPDPDPATSFAERQRLFALPRSSWDDYDRSSISAGGGVHPRTAKSIPLSPEVRERLGVSAESLPPPDLIRAILTAPVDLFWNGGVGTYVKASTEGNADVGDKTNDPVRVNGAELRCRVVGEGGNLGFTQRGRVEYALAGGHIFTDSIDNSAGVDCSDHEVNIKILLNAIVRRGQLTVAQRNELLVDMTDEVAEHVLRHNYEHTQALSIARAQAASLVDVHGRYITALEQAGRLDRNLEFLPTADELADRRSRGQGLTTPELSILLAYAKVTIDREILDSDLPEDPYLDAILTGYFPAPLRARYRDEIEGHPLRREIISTVVSNVLVNRGGTSFAYRLADETQAAPSAIARCHLAASAAFDMSGLWRRIEALDNQVAVDTQITMLLASRRLVERATRWLLQNRRAPLDITATVATFREGIGQLWGWLPDVLVGSDRERWTAAAAELVDQGVPAELAGEVAGIDAVFSALDLVEVATATGCELQDVARVYFLIGQELRFDWLRNQILALPRDDRWRTLARASLRTDLYARHRAITAEIVAPAPAGGPFDAESLIKQWLDHHGPIVDRYEQLVRDMTGNEPLDLAVLSVALRVVQDLAS